MKKVIITGADGFLGSHLVQKLMEEQIEIWAVIYPGSRTKEKARTWSSVHCIECDLNLLEQNKAEFPLNADAFYHFAWQGVGAKDRDNYEMQIKNIALCMNCIKFAADLNVKKFILPGSTSEYLYYGKPINKCAVPSPQNAYGCVKAVLHFLAKDYAKEQGISFIYTVITGIYASDRRDNNLIFYTIDKLLRKEKPSVTKLEQLWDYVNIEDVVDALFLIGEKGKEDAFYTIGHGDNQPLYRYMEKIQQSIDPGLPIGVGEVPYQKEQLPSSCVDLSAIYEDTGFVPKVDFETGIKEVIKRMKEEY